MNELFIEKLFNRKVQFADCLSAEMMAIGSILDDIILENGQQMKSPPPYPIKVWGTGLVSSYMIPPVFRRTLDIYALRGQLTREIVSKAIGKDVECVLADPGLLASLMIEPVKKHYDIGIIPHYVDFKLPEINDLKDYYENSIIINVRDDFYNVIQKILSCRCVVSSSLHGLIIADSFNIPNQWIVASDKVIGDGFKFRDYYSSYNLDAKCYDLRKKEIPTIKEIYSGYKIKSKDVQQKQKDLLDSFPLK